MRADFPRWTPVAGSTAPRKYPCGASTVEKIVRAHSAGSAGGKYRGSPVCASTVCTMTVTVNPVAAGNHASAAAPNGAMDVWICSSIFVPVRAAVMMCESAQTSSVARCGSAWSESVWTLPRSAGMGLFVPFSDDLVGQAVHRQFVGDTDLGGALLGCDERDDLLVPLSAISVQELVASLSEVLEHQPLEAVETSGDLGDTHPLRLDCAPPVNQVRSPEQYTEDHSADRCDHSASLLEATDFFGSLVTTLRAMVAAIGTNTVSSRGSENSTRSPPRRQRPRRRARRAARGSGCRGPMCDLGA